VSFIIRPASENDLLSLHQLASSLSAYGFLTLPAEKEELESLIHLSTRSFQDKLMSPDEGQYLFVLENLTTHQAIGSSLVIARHGTFESPHLYFQINKSNNALTFCAETNGRTELGGLILDPAYRSHPTRLGKVLSLIRFLYIIRHREKFQTRILAEFLPPLSAKGSPFWESLGKKWTGMSYREANELSRHDKSFFLKTFPREPIAIDSLSVEAKKVVGTVGPKTIPAVKIVEKMGLHYLDQIDPFDGGPHYGALMEQVHFDRAEEFFRDHPEVTWTFQPS
jgi:arginine N-succinyltransferase